MNILRISGEMSLWRAWDQFWAVKGQKKQDAVVNGSAKFPKASDLFFGCLSPWKGYLIPALVLLVEHLTIK